MIFPGTDKNYKILKELLNTKDGSELLNSLEELAEINRNMLQAQGNEHTSIMIYGQLHLINQLRTIKRGLYE